jgi:hypothetical protein
VMPTGEQRTLTAVGTPLRQSTSKGGDDQPSTASQCRTAACRTAAQTQV